MQDFLKLFIMAAIIGIVTALCLPQIVKKNDTWVSATEEFEKHQAERDSLIGAYEAKIDLIQLERDLLLADRIDLNERLDSAVSIIKRSTKVVVTDDDVKEALIWIEETHGID